MLAANYVFTSCNLLIAVYHCENTGNQRNGSIWFWHLLFTAKQDCGDGLYSCLLMFRDCFFTSVHIRLMYWTGRSLEMASYVELLWSWRRWRSLVLWLDVALYHRLERKYGHHTCQVLPWLPSISPNLYGVPTDVSQFESFMLSLFLCLLLLFLRLLLFSLRCKSNLC